MGEGKCLEGIPSAPGMLVHSLPALVLALGPVLFVEMDSIAHTICALFGSRAVLGMKSLKCTEWRTKKGMDRKLFPKGKT